MSLEQLIVDGMAVGSVAFVLVLLVGIAAAALYEVKWWLQEGVFCSKVTESLKELFWVVAFVVVSILVITLVGILLTLLYLGVTFYL